MNGMKKLISVILTAMLICISTSAFASDSQIISVGAFRGKLYYCDVPTERVVIKEIAPCFPTAESAQTAREAEYLEISIATEGIFLNNGSRLTADYLNDYADSEVWFVLAKAQNGNLTIPYLVFK